MKTQNQKRYLILLALVLVLAVQTVMMGYFGQKKVGYQHDGHEYGQNALLSGKQPVNE